MSQAIQRGIIILTGLLVAVAVGAMYLGYLNNKLKSENLTLQDKLKEAGTQISEARKNQEKALADSQKLGQEIDNLKSRLGDKEKENSELQSSYDQAKRKADEVSGQVDQANRERDDWKNKIETIRKERDDLMTKLQNQPEKIVYKDRPVEVPAASESTETPSMPQEGAVQNDEYWAKILKQKAELEVKLDKAKADLDKSALEVADLKKESSELQIQITNLNTDKTDIERRLTNEKKALADNFAKERQDLKRKIRDGEDLASNLSLEVARARGDQKSANDFGSKVKDDNSQLQSEVKRLASTKVALEKTVARLSQEKNDMGKKLADTEGVIQDRINEIWQIKQTLDQKITQMSQVKDKDVELPPIIVNASGGSNTSASAVAASETVPETMNQVHKVISINQKNHFVIVDMGESQGSKIGRVIKVKRGGKEIATLEVIQVRRDISAADIKDQKASVQVGDQVQ